MKWVFFGKVNENFVLNSLWGLVKKELDEDLNARRGRWYWRKQDMFSQFGVAHKLENLRIDPCIQSRGLHDVLCGSNINYMNKLLQIIIIYIFIYFNSIFIFYDDRST